MVRYQCDPTSGAMAGSLEAPMAKLPHSVRLDFGLEESQWPPLVVALDNFRGTN